MCTEALLPSRRMAFRIESTAALLMAQAPWLVALIAAQHVGTVLAEIGGADSDGADLVPIGAIAPGRTSRAIAPLAESGDGRSLERHPVTLNVAAATRLAHAATRTMLIRLLNICDAQPIGWQEVRHDA
jgi:hypothetical protein